MADPSYNTKKYTPPGLRNPSGVNKKIGDRAGSQQSKDGERSQPQMEKASQKIITLKDSATSEAYQLLSERWAAAMHQYNDPTVDLSERPVMYYGGSVWGKLPHQILASANNTLPPKITPADYRAEVRRGLLTPRSSSN
ncbi:BnaC05g44360D [Brassica napus]|uniref:Uncharacterized protein n=3 Tax=Brassica TaxID=3705 RepID=A0A0D3CM02_BRAOL|nr:PREDICTED: uncharacterized protein LOC106296136 isoform X1 [Brassica oleracea var. oleracea]XP_013697548.1 uncharacterized protein BNAC05G44360D isoform X1 [Brassica napus]CAF1936218.1 unnamed protein product [Brassica napus]CDY28034.1 BnaC05g44360D [Brassica napus]VDD47079.1 unnamed protein product [Brassica oleracea]